MKLKAKLMSKASKDCRYQVGTQLDVGPDGLRYNYRITVYGTGKYEGIIVVTGYHKTLTKASKAARKKFHKEQRKIRNKLNKVPAF